MWFCPLGAQVEGALKANPDWAARIDVRRVAFQRPRAAVIAHPGENNQGLPVLILRAGATIPQQATAAGAHHVLTESLDIANDLARTYGGAAPHP